MFFKAVLKRKMEILIVLGIAFVIGAIGFLSSYNNIKDDNALLLSKNSKIASENENLIRQLEEARIKIKNLESDKKEQSQSGADGKIINNKAILRSKHQDVLENNNLPRNFEFTSDFRTAFDLMENTNISLFITGKAGTGKSTLVEYFRIKTNKKTVFLAPTGIAALNIRGKTIHSLFQFPPEIITIDKIKHNIYGEAIQEIFKKVDTIVIDEISMVRSDLMEGIDYILKKFRDKEKPFGGVQMIFIGDIYQLPPVVKKNDKIDIKNDEEVFRGSSHDYLQKKYGGPYFFNYDEFKKANFKYYELTTVFRQKDNEFIDILNSIRENNITASLLDKLNERHNQYTKWIEKSNSKKIFLCTTNAIVDNINKQKISELPVKSFSYEAKISGIFEKLEDKDYPADKTLVLKENTQVMMIKNDKDGRWVNGTIGIAKNLTNDIIEIEIHGTVFTVNLETWESVEYEYNEKTDELKTYIIGTFTQYPLKPAWAITIHKSQGKTFDEVIIDLGHGAFTYGQTYVALSRCKTLNGILLKQPIKRSDIKLDNAVVNFIKEMKNNTGDNYENIITF
jgi:ATP-dependent exoDNAse (exonuclease V) alpha subunit